MRKGAPDHIRGDKCSEFTATRVRAWLERVGVKTLSIEKGSLWENGDAERFNRKLRGEFLAREVFDTLLETKVFFERWRLLSTTVRPPAHWGTAPRPRVARPLSACFDYASASGHGRSIGGSLLLTGK